MNIKYWFDITNTPHIHIVASLKNSIEAENASFVFTARDFSEVLPMVSEKFIGYDLFILGGHGGKSKIKKTFSVIKRFKDSFYLPFDYDVSISMGSESAIWSSFLKNKPTIAFGDNDTAKQWTYGHVVSFAFFPSAIPENILKKQGLKNKLYLYNGFKEDIYISDYEPDEKFKKTIPFDNYVLVRAENLQANYINNNSESICRNLLERLSGAGYNIVFLPRYKNDLEYAAGIDNVYIPDQPLNGLDACYFAEAVLTGAGTLAREAACLGVPAVSFYAGKNLLAVDKKMISDGWMYHSRDPQVIIENFKNMKRRNVSTDRSKEVKHEVITKLKEVLEKLLN